MIIFLKKKRKILRKLNCQKNCQDFWDRILAEKNNNLNTNFSISKQERIEIQQLAASYSMLIEKRLNKILEITENQNNSIGFYGINCTMPNIFSWIPELHDRKILIYDSDSLKWNRYFSGVPFIVNSPDKLNLVDKVIVVPYRLHEEIFTFLLENNFSKAEVIKLYD